MDSIKNMERIVMNHRHDAKAEILDCVVNQLRTVAEDEGSITLDRLNQIADFFESCAKQSREQIEPVE